MNELNEAYKRIEILRELMYRIIEEEKDILSYKVIAISQRLDEELINYHKLDKP